MANQSAKKTAQSNQTILRPLYIVCALLHAVYWSVRLGWQSGSLTLVHHVMYGATDAVALLLLLQLHRISQPTLDAYGRLVTAGQDLSAPGLVQYMFDVIYITWCTHALVLMTDYGWWLWLVIPLYVVYWVGTQGWRTLTANPVASLTSKSRSSKSSQSRQATHRMAGRS